MTASLHLRTRRRLALLVACALLVRGLIPEGFMPVSGAGGLSVELCPAGGVMPPAMATHDAHRAQAGHAGHRVPHPGAPHPSCVFSSGASVAFSAALSVPTPAAPIIARFSAPAGARHHVPAILRAQSSRGPPSLA
jgi:hypothetical protein